MRMTLALLTSAFLVLAGLTLAVGGASAKIVCADDPDTKGDDLCVGLCSTVSGTGVGGLGCRSGTQQVCAAAWSDSQPEPVGVGGCTKLIEPNLRGEI